MAYGQSYECFPYHKFGITAEQWLAQPSKTRLILKVERRLVLHDGYCSDPGEDVGQSETVTERYKVSQTLIDLITTGDALNLEYLKMCFDSDNLGCGCGSNYCGYEGSVKLLSARVLQ